MKFRQANSEAEIEQVRALFREYAAWIEISLCFQNFDEEVGRLPGEYAPEQGRLLLGLVDEQVAGCIALRPLDVEACEMKRLYLRPEYQGKGLGREMAEKIIEEARKIGYKRMLLDTLPGRMDKAISLYRSLGFKEIPPYYPNPVKDAKFMELIL
jgi:putative acetyltransferase